jgi:hypothetical protein
MSDVAAAVLTAALLVDAVSNAVRVVYVEIAYRRQTELLRRSEMEYEARMAAAREVLEPLMGRD